MTTHPESPPARRTFLSALGGYTERRSLVMMALGFAAGLPFLLIFDTLSAWLRDVGLTLEVIGFFSLATLVYSFKFLWAPLVDRTRVPFLTRWLGHRRSWMLVCQCLIVLGLWLVAGTDPTQHLALMALFAVIVGFVSATQDIAIDAWRIEAADVSRQGAMAASLPVGLPRRHDHGGRRAAAAGRSLQLEFLLRGHGRAHDHRHRGYAAAHRGSTMHEVRRHSCRGRSRRARDATPWSGPRGCACLPSAP